MEESVLLNNPAQLFKEVITMSKQHRSAVTGKYVTKAYAQKHPKTTVSKTPKSGSSK
jgi:hypothetical protein